MCLRVPTGRAINAYEPSLLEWQGPQFVTLTLPTVPGDALQDRIEHLIREPGHIADYIRRTDGLPFKAPRKLECTLLCTPIRRGSPGSVDFLPTGGSSDGNASAESRRTADLHPAV